MNVWFWLKKLVWLLLVAVISGCTLDAQLMFGALDSSSLLPAVYGPDIKEGSHSSTFEWRIESIEDLDISNVHLQGADTSGCLPVLVSLSASVHLVRVSGCSGNGFIYLQISRSDMALTSGEAKVVNSKVKVNVGSVTPASGGSSTSFYWPVKIEDAAEINLAVSHVSFIGNALGCAPTIESVDAINKRVRVTGCLWNGSLALKLAPGIAKDTDGVETSEIISTSLFHLINSYEISFVDKAETIANKDNHVSSQSFNLKSVALPAEVVVEYSVTSASTDVSEFTPLKGSVTLPAGTTTGVISLDFLGNLAAAGSRQLQVSIDKLSPGPFALGMTSVRRTLLDNTQDNKFSFVSTAPGNRCAITMGGNLYCWGVNTNGDLGNGTTVSSNSLVLVDSPVKYKMVSVSGSGATCAVTTGNVLKCWGKGIHATNLLPQVIDTEVTWVSVPALYNNSSKISIYCYQKESSTPALTGLWCKKDGANPPVQINNTVYSKFVSGGEWDYSHSYCGIRSSDQKLECWGLGRSGILGNGLVGDGSWNDPQAIDSGSSYIDVSLSQGLAACGLTTTNQLKCWGLLGHDMTATLTPTVQTADVSPSPLKKLGVLRHSPGTTQRIGVCGLRLNNTLWCNGYNSTGGSGLSLGYGLFDENTTYQSVSHSIDKSCGITSDGILKCWTSSVTRKTLGAVAADSGVPYIDSNLRYRKVSSGSHHNCAITEDGDLQCWGLTYGTTFGAAIGEIARSRPLSIDSGTKYKDISFGGNSDQFSGGCGVTIQGYLKCWGAGGLGPVSSTQTIRVVDTSRKYHSVSVTPMDSAKTACALTNENKLYCWGANASGQVGDGTNTTRPSPTLIAGGMDFIKVTMGSQFGCALTPTGEVYCWGANTSGQLGIGTNVASNTPVRVSLPGVTFKNIQAGGNHVCAISDLDRVYCWGSNSGGILGIGTSTGTKTSPELINDSATYVFLVARGIKTCGITTNQVVKCWGGNIATSPKDMQLTGTYNFLSVGDAHICGMVPDPLDLEVGRVKCWGDNSYGQSGRGEYLWYPTVVLPPEI
ncbi:hypothetical protein [Bdellovibrio bacteriovorus]|uniref:hypothetical protein n=1 Tax=Bdellovibrio bacteriovorus TaxID=959 RepID=UPI0035A6148B